MTRSVSVTTLAKNCPLYIHLSHKYPLQKETLETVFGSIIHTAVEQMLKTGEEIPDIIDYIKTHSTDKITITMLEDEVMLRIINRHLHKVREIIKTLPKPLAIELPIEHKLEGFLIKGRIDAIFPGNPPIIADWKTGSFSSREHELQLQIYAYISWRNGILTPPIKTLGIYLGNEDIIKTVSATFGEEELIKTEQRIIELLDKSSKGIPPVNPSTSCTFCPYRFRCASYYSETVLAQVWNKVSQTENISQHRRLGFKIIKLSEKLKAMGNRLLDNQGTSTPRQKLRNQNNIWASQLRHVIPHLEERELRNLLNVMSAEMRDIDLDKLPAKVREILRKFGTI